MSVGSQEFRGHFEDFTTFIAFCLFFLHFGKEKKLLALSPLNVSTDSDWDLEFDNG